MVATSAETSDDLVDKLFKIPQHAIARPLPLAYANEMWWLLNVIMPVCIMPASPNRKVQF